VPLAIVPLLPFVKGYGRPRAGKDRMQANGGDQ
jgi:hypothetical protein